MADFDQPLVPSQEQIDVKDSSPLIKTGWLRALVFLISFGLFQLLFGGIVVAISAIWDKPEIMEGAMKATGGVMLFQLVASFGVAILLWKVIDRRPIVELGFSFDREKRIDLAAGLGVGIALQTTIFVTLYLMGQIEVVGISFPAASFFSLLLTLTLVAIQEETLFRGYMLSNLMASMNRWVALLLISSIFAFLHAMNPNASAFGIINIVLAGILLGVYYVHKQNLWFPIGIHLTWNFFQGVIYGSPVSGIETESVLQVEFGSNEMLTGGSFGFEASALATVVCLITIVLIHLKYRKPARPASTVVDSAAVFGLADEKMT